MEKNEVGVVEGSLIDDYGKKVEGKIDERKIGIKIERMRMIEMSIEVEGGLDKVKEIIEEMRGGYINVMIKDEEKGSGIINEDGVKGIERKI